MLICLTGLPQVGKDTFADFICNKYGLDRYAFADPIKKCLCAIFDWPMSIFDSETKEKEDPFWHISPREAMEYIGTKIMKQEICKEFPAFDSFIKDQIWVKRFEKFYKSSTKDIVITDLRYKPEFDFLSNIEEKVIIRINRESVDSTRWYDILNYSFNYSISNNSTLADYHKKVDELFKTIGEKYGHNNVLNASLQSM